MKQTTKRFYGTLVGVAFLSGLTGAFAYSLSQKSVDKVLPSFSFTEPKKAQEPVSNLMTLSTASAPAVQPVDLTEAAEKACNAVVYIKVVQKGRKQTIEYRDPFEDFFGDFFGRGGGGTQRRQVETPKREAAGSGVIISEDGYIVTNNHVVEDADDITITLNDNREFKARVIGLDADSDLALLKIDASGLPAIVIGDSEQLKVGEWVLAVGNPFNLTSTVTAGIVSAKARNIGAHKNGIESFIQTDAAINQGNSGGALVNTRGDLVGINAMLYSQTGSFTGYGFAIPTTIMKKVVNDLQAYGTVQRAMIGISGMTLHDYIDAKKHDDEKFSADFGTVDGVYVAEVVDDGAAADAGIKSGDNYLGRRQESDKDVRIARGYNQVSPWRQGTDWLHPRQEGENHNHHVPQCEGKHQRDQDPKDGCTGCRVQRADRKPEDDVESQLRSTSDKTEEWLSERCWRARELHHPEGKQPEHQVGCRLGICLQIGTNKR